jgi:hypothetical protein
MRQKTEFKIDGAINSQKNLHKQYQDDTSITFLNFLASIEKDKIKNWGLDHLFGHHNAALI